LLNRKKENTCFGIHLFECFGKRGMTTIFQTKLLTWKRFSRVSNIPLRNVCYRPMSLVQLVDICIIMQGIGFELRSSHSFTLRGKFQVIRLLD
jgi:hypothetical protein